MTQDKIISRKIGPWGRSNSFHWTLGYSTARNASHLYSWALTVLFHVVRGGHSNPLRCSCLESPVERAPQGRKELDLTEVTWRAVHPVSKVALNFSPLSLSVIYGVVFNTPSSTLFEYRVLVSYFWSVPVWLWFAYDFKWKRVTPGFVPHPPASHFCCFSALRAGGLACTVMPRTELVRSSSPELWKGPLWPEQGLWY